MDSKVLIGAICDKIWFSKILTNKSKFLWIQSSAQQDILLHTGS